MELQKRLSFRLISRGDLRQARTLFDRFRPTVAGTTCPFVFAAYCRDAVWDRGCVIALAIEDGTPCGIVISVFNRVHYWLWLCVRHPIVMLAILLKRVWVRVCRRRGSAGAQSATRRDVPTTDPAALRRHWRENSAKIAKTIFIGVAPEARKRGVARQLYEYLFGVLRQKGVTRIDAHIDEGNIASVRLHQASGWQVSFDGSDWLATKDISSS
jgi:GNAT superfamily N-acetyltransferase